MCIRESDELLTQANRIKKSATICALGVSVLGGKRRLRTRKSTGRTQGRCIRGIVNLDSFEDNSAQIGLGEA